MPISGLVITLDDDHHMAETAVRAVEEHGRFEIEPRRGQRVPAVLDTPDRRTDRRCWDWLNQLPGVRRVDVVFIHFDEEDSGTPPHPLGRSGRVDLVDHS